MSDRTALVRRRRARYGPTTETGFTLIELLVVVVILGILSAVVVFAVRGVGDKGQGAAVATDERTIRTAQEAYCAKAGRYATDMGQLTGDLPVSNTDPAKYKFLSEPSEYHKLEPGPPACGGTPGYKIVCKVADCSAVDPSGPDPSGPGPSDPDSPALVARWQLVVPGPTIIVVGPLVRLADGRVFASGVDSAFEKSLAQIWDPVMNTWTLTDPPPYGVSGDFGDSALLLTDDPTTATVSECSNGVVDNCGKVFVFGKYLFDPTAAPGGQWATIPNNLGAVCSICNGGSQYFGFVQLMKRVAPCGTKCGTVLMFVRGSNSGYNNYDAFDPRTNTYSVIPLSSDPEVNVTALSMQVQLPDGRILLCCNSADGGDTNLRSFFLDPLTFEYSEGPAPPARYSRGDGTQPPVLPNGEFFFSARTQSRTAINVGIYKPQAGGPGAWRTVPSCIPPLALPTIGDPEYCRTLAPLPDGRVLVLRTTGNPSRVEDTVSVFNPATDSWSPSPSLISRFSYFWDAVLMDPADGPCGSYCGRVLVASSTAEVYTPGPASLLPVPVPVTGLG